MNDPKQIAALVLAKCAAYDPWFPKAAQAIVESWAEQIERHAVSLVDAIEGVAKMYADNGSGFRPLPKDLTDAARAIRRQRDAESGPTPEYEARCESKAEDAAELEANRRARALSPPVERPEFNRLIESIAGRKGLPS